jgi:hypothetical protein
LSFLTHLKLLTRLPDNHVSFKRQLTLNALQSLLLTLEAAGSGCSWGLSGVGRENGRLSCSRLAQLRRNPR